MLVGIDLVYWISDIVWGEGENSRRPVCVEGTYLFEME